MFGNTLLIIATLAGLATLVGLATAALALARRWANSAVTRFDRLQRSIEKTNADASENARLLRRRMDALQRRLDEVEEQDVQRSKDSQKLLVRKSSEIVKATRTNVAKDLAATFTQLESLHNLYAIAPPAHPLPASRNWAASPDLLLLLVDLVERTRPRLVVECGSGLSTLWLAIALRRFEVDGRVVALEHSPSYAAQTRRMLATHGMDAYAEVRDAPLREHRVGEQVLPWYAEEGWSDLDGIRLLFVDGPPGKTAPLARYPALPLLSSHLAPEATVVLDDMNRSDEQDTVRRWLEEDGDFEAEHIRLEKKAAVLTRGKAPSPTSRTPEPQPQEPAG